VEEEDASYGQALLTWKARGTRALCFLSFCPPDFNR
jgi:hypothetical protein